MQCRQGSKSQMNDYEKKRMSRIQENKNELQARGLKPMADSLTSLVESDKPKKNKKKLIDSSDKDVDVEYSPGSDVDDEEDYQEAAKKVSKKKQRPTYIAPQTMNRYSNLTNKRFVAPVVSRVLRSLESHGERDKRLHDIHEQRDDAETDDVEDIAMNEDYGDKDMAELDKENAVENRKDELVEEEVEIQENEGHEVSNQENEAKHLPNVTNGHQRLRVGDEVLLKSILNST